VEAAAAAGEVVLFELLLTLSVPRTQIAPPKKSATISKSTK
jgi:hypothetical protein